MDIIYINFWIFCKYKYENIDNLYCLICSKIFKLIFNNFCYYYYCENVSKIVIVCDYNRFDFV